MRTLLLHSVGMWLALGASAQVRVDRPLEFTGSAPDQRQVLGLPDTDAPGAVLSASTALQGGYRTGTALVEAADVWTCTVSGLFGAPVPGTHLFIAVPAVPSGAVNLRVNEEGPYPITHAGLRPFTGEGFPAGSMLSLVFDGTGFQVMNGVQRARMDCPTGMVAVNDEYCIDIDARTPTNFFTASMTCAQEDRRICAWGEWAAACERRVALGLLNIADTWEWTNSTANGDGNVRVAGQDCSFAGTSWSFGDPDRKYRCCYTR